MLSNAAHDFVVKENLVNQHNRREDFKVSKRADGNTLHKAIIAVKQNNIDLLKSKLLEIATPSSHQYGRHLTHSQVGELVSNEKSSNAIKEWIKSYSNAHIVSETDHGEYITIRAPVETLEKMLNTQFFLYESTKDTSSIVRAQTYSIPSYLVDDIHAIFHVSNLPFPKKQSANGRKREQHISFPGYMTPQTLQALYNIPPDTSNYTFGTQAVYEATGSTFDTPDMLIFQKLFNLSHSVVSNVIGNIPGRSQTQIGSDLEYVQQNIASSYEPLLDLEYMMGIAPNVSTTYYYDDDINDNDFLTFIFDIATSPNPALVYSISYGTYENTVTKDEMDAFNTEAIKLGLKGVTLIAATGDDGVSGYYFGGGTLPIDQCGYFPMWPASSPYVTAVGATMNGGPVNGLDEIVCSRDTDGEITSGGGFSTMNNALDFQKVAISEYLSKVTPPQSHYSPFNANGRGYPDVAMAANKYLTIVGGSFFEVSGTSASAPVFAGIVSLVNSLRIQKNYPPIGFMNPALYANNGDIFNDITSGNNACTQYPGICCLSAGFDATPGWDPATGLGSVDFIKFSNYFLNLNMSNVPQSTIPTSKPSSKPTKAPVVYHKGYPTKSPRSNPTLSPSSVSPTIVPSSAKSASPTLKPSAYKSSSPSLYPSSVSSVKPTFISTKAPSIFATVVPSTASSGRPSIVPSAVSSSKPTSMSSTKPTSMSSTKPTAVLSIQPSSFITSHPTEFDNSKSEPTLEPTAFPSLFPSIFVSKAPSTVPTSLTSRKPTARSTTATAKPSNAATARPSVSSITSKPSNQPTLDPTKMPTFIPTKATTYPTLQPSLEPTTISTVLPSSFATGVPSLYLFPTKAPSAEPTLDPTSEPTIYSQPTLDPTADPSLYPSIAASHSPTIVPSWSTTRKPTARATLKPTTMKKVNVVVTTSPTSSKTSSPTAQPSNDPTNTPILIARFPTAVPTSEPTFSPTTNPTTNPTSEPTSEPTLAPTSM